MSRAIDFLLRNWPLKLAAIVLSTLLYAGLVVSQNAHTLRVSIPIQAFGQPADTYLLTELGSVEEISYLTTDETLRPSTATFQAWVDLSDVPAGEPTLVPVQVRAIDEAIQITGIVPGTVLVRLDPLTSKTVPVDVRWGEPPPNLEVREPTVTPPEVTVSGPQSVVERVAAARADVVIETSALDVDREVQLVPVDAVGEPLAPIDVEPRTARVRIPVFSDLETRSLPVYPVVTGTPAPGYEVASVTVEPSVVTVEGDADQLAALSRLDTQPVAISGATGTVESTVALALPEDVLPLRDETVAVTVEIRQVTGTRSFSVGVRLVGARGDRTYGLSTDRVVLTVGGPLAVLDRIQGSSLTARVDVAALEPGSHDVRVAADLPAGVTLVTANPSSLTVTVGVPEPTPTPVPSPVSSAPSPSPSAQ